MTSEGTLGTHFIMKTIGNKIIMGIGLLTALIAFGLEVKPEKEERKTYGVRYLPGAAITLDGLGHHSSWKMAAVLSDFSFPWKPEPAPLTEFRGICDDSYFHFIFRVEDEDLVFMEDIQIERDIGRSDRVEFFFSTDPAMRNYYGLEIDPLGRVLDYQASYDRQLNREWDWPGLETKAIVVGGGYVVQGRIPLDSFAELGFPRPRPGVGVLVGVFRAEFRYASESEGASLNNREPPNNSRAVIRNWISWVDPGTEKPNFHTPSALGWFEIME